jgi:N-acetylmuramoyl-L-alanine amidase
LLALLPLASAAARVRHNDAWARQEFTQAERMREALNGRPAAERTRREYQHAIDAYRRVYFGAPASSKANPSVVATAELMVEMGRRFNDDKILRGAVEEYRFLRKEYPGSKYRFDALFTIGEIYKDDLNDPKEARATFEEFLHRYPHNRLADDARSAVKEIDDEAAELERSAQNAERKPKSNASASAANVNAKSDDEAAESAKAEIARRNELPRVTGIRHWSTPDYTRVAIDVEQEVKYNSQRIANPDRIYFDLRDTKLASTLVGKTFDVDDGFLKKVRVAEFQPGLTRIVLEVDNLASYDAFLLPDPYRLIIDIHGKDVPEKVVHGAENGAALKAKASQGKTGMVKATTSKTEMASARAHSAPDASTTASTDTDDDASEPAMATKPAFVEKDLPTTASSADTQSSGSAKPKPKSTNGTGVVKTTVAVQGSDRRIPKTIVNADDNADDSANDGANDSADNGADKEANDTANVSADDGVPAKSHTPVSPSSSSASSSLSSALASNSPKRNKSGSSTAAADTADLRPDSRHATREARPTASGNRSLTRALGLKIGKIVIDPGHGGHDTGTIGPNGLREKDVVLDVAMRLGRLLESRLGAEVVYTRQDDTFIPLETRTAIANRERADLFISIHANSSRDADARGVETYYLNFTSSPEALEVAARENAVSEKSIHELQDLVKKIALKEKIEESREFAGDVQQSLYGGLALNNDGIRNRGIKKAPFIVLIGANMPSILAEISFVSNPTDERKMETEEHRQRIAESLYRGVSKYVGGLSGVKVASKANKHEGQ